MTTIAHPELVKALVKPPIDIIKTLSESKVDLWHAATGISGEAAELVEAVVQPTHEGTWDYDNIMEELGDIYFYVEQMAQRLELKIDYPSIATLAFTELSEPDKRHSIHALRHVVSVVIAAGYVLDTVKKAAVYNKDLDADNLGAYIHQLLEAMEKLMLCVVVERDTCIAANIAKLSKRYESLSYTDAAAHARADKEPARKPFKGEEDTRPSDA